MGWQIELGDRDAIMKFFLTIVSEHFLELDELGLKRLRFI